MKVKIVSLFLVLVVALCLVLASTAVAKSSTIDQIIKDAQDGTINGHWTAAQIQAALNYISGNPLYAQYSDLAGVLGDYLASLQAPDAVNGQLAFTGSNVLLIIAAGLGLTGGGFVLRRSRA
jgi:hypothetical protein